MAARRGRGCGLNSADLPVISRGFSQTGTTASTSPAPSTSLVPGVAEPPADPGVIRLVASPPAGSPGSFSGSESAPDDPVDTGGVRAAAGERGGHPHAPRVLPGGHRTAASRRACSARSSDPIAPDFLFRIERDPVQALPGSVHRISDAELRRGCRFSCGAHPDDELLIWRHAAGCASPPSSTAGPADAGDSRSSALVTNFASQWLIVRNLRNAAPDAQMFLGFQRHAARGVPPRDGSVRPEPDSRGPHARRRADGDHIGQRTVTRASTGSTASTATTSASRSRTTRAPLGQRILTVTSHPTRTPPTLRGKWVENILACRLHTTERRGPRRKARTGTLSMRAWSSIGRMRSAPLVTGQIDPRSPPSEP